MGTRLDFEKDRRNRLPRDTVTDCPGLISEELSRAARFGAPEVAAGRARLAKLCVPGRTVFSVKQGKCSGCNEEGKVSFVESNWGFVSLCSYCLARARERAATIKPLPVTKSRKNRRDAMHYCYR